jgi:chromosome partitioning protein
MQEGHRVRLLDSDPQGTLAKWGERRRHPDPLVETVSSTSQLDRRLRAFAAGGATMTIIDTASGESALARAAMRAADLCIIPARPSQADLESAVHTLRAIRRLGKPFCFVLNQAPIRSPHGTGAGAAFSVTARSLSATGVLALPYITMRHDHMDALGVGLAVTEYEAWRKSADEIRALWGWLWYRLSASADQAPAWRLAG